MTENQSQPAPKSSILEVDGFILKYKGYLKTPAFSYRCQNYHSLKCPFLFSVPINSSNYNLETWECISLNGAKQSSTSGHLDKCKKRREENLQSPLIKGNQTISEESNRKIVSRGPIFYDTQMMVEENNRKIVLRGPVFSEWRSDLPVLKECIIQNLRLGPKLIQAIMKQMKQSFSLRIIKETKKEIYNELFPKDRKIAFHPSNCLVHEAEDNYQDNLLKYSSQILNLCKGKNTSAQALNTQEFIIFATTTMLFQLERSSQWFVDGTFAIAPTGFQQLIVIIVLLPDLNIFYPGCYILATNKTQRLYTNAFRALLGLGQDEGFNFKPKVIMSDFEVGLQNALRITFNISNNEDSPTKLAGCYFHYVKALIKRAKYLGILTRKNNDDKGKIIIGLLKILAHCPPEKKEDFFDEMETMYKSQGEKYKNFLSYYKKNWLHNNFLAGLFTAYNSGEADIKFIRVNNPCELFNKYIGKFKEKSLNFKIGQVFEFKKPSPGYFIQKLKDIEFTFRGQYIDQCKGKSRNKRKWNFEKNPLENMDLPQQELLDLCCKAVEETGYNLRNLSKNKEFMQKVQNMTTKYIGDIEFSHLKTQSEEEKLENKMKSDNEGEKNEPEDCKLIEENEEVEEVEEEEEEEEDEEEKINKKEEKTGKEFEGFDNNTQDYNHESKRNEMHQASPRSNF